MRAVIAVIVLFAAPAIALAQGNRANSWEWSFAVLYQESKSMGSTAGSSLNVDDDYGIGFNFGYNFTNHLTLGVDLDWLSPDYKAVLVDDSVSPARTTTIDHEFSQFNGRIKGTYSFLDGPFMPFVEAGIGWSYFDSNVLDGPPITGCYWHPWWGYICSNFYSTFSSTTFTYGAGLGFRYHFRGGSFLKASYNVWELDDLGNVSDSTISGARLEFGWGF
jgi:opacity protein-like surface antigen